MTAAAQPPSDRAMRARIEHVELTRLAFPLPRPFRAAVRVIDSVEILLVRITTRDAQGCGYAFAFGSADLAPIAAAAEGLVPALVGREGIHVERHWAAMQQALALAGAGGAALAACSAIDLALWDLLGKTAGLPLAQLLGGARDSVGVYGSGGSLQLEVPELVAQARAFQAAGYPAYKFKAGHGLAADRERLAALRSALGAGFRLIVDGNQQWTAKEAIQAAHAFAAHDVWWLEEPVPAGDFEACAEVRAAVPMQIATGETNFGVAEFSRLLARRATDILMPNLQRVGGITGWRKVAAMAELHGVPMASHVYAEIGVHLMCAAPNGLTLEVLPWWPNLFTEALRVEAGRAHPPAGPGFGVTLDPAVIAAHRVG